VISTGGGVKQHVQLLGRGLVGIRASDGLFMWGYNRVNNVANIATPIVKDDFVFASTGYDTAPCCCNWPPRRRPRQRDREHF
jgi:hypothetical protein